jgi:hypothetical protein
MHQFGKEAGRRSQQVRAIEVCAAGVYHKIPVVASMMARDVPIMGDVQNTVLCAIACVMTAQATFARSGWQLAGTLAQMRALSAQNDLEGSGLPTSSERLPRSISTAAVFVRFSYGGFDVICEKSEKWLILAEREGFEPSKGF